MLISVMGSWLHTLNVSWYNNYAHYVVTCITHLKAKKNCTNSIKIIILVREMNLEVE